MAVALILLVNMVASGNLAAIGVALPALSTGLGVPPTQALWIADAFLVANVCATPMTPFLLERLGARRLLLVCVVGIMTASALAAVADAMLPLAVVVFMQGLCAAPLLPATQTIAVDRFPGAQRSRGMAVWATGSTAGQLLGALLGGWLCARFGWPWIFAPAVVLGLATLPLILREAGGTSRAVAVDWLGLVTFGVGFLTLSTFLNVGDNVDWHRTPSVLLLPVTALVSLGAFAWHARRTEKPIVDLRPLANRDLATTAFLCFGIGAFSTAFFQTAMLGSVLGFDATFLGVRGALGSVALMLGLALAGRALGWSRPLIVFAAGLVLLTGGKVGFTYYGPGLTDVGAVWPAVLSSIGFGVITAVLATLAFRSLPPAAVGAASGLFVLSQQLGYALGVAMLDVYLQERTLALLADGTPRAFAVELAFLELFWVELIAAVLLPVAVLVRRRPVMAPLPAPAVERG
jgi:MFS transporter, DHA2 family, multidrug resistance protein